MLNRGFKEVYQIEGGIARYGQKYRDAGLWEGALYVFDNRMAVSFSEDALTLGTCVNCPEKDFAVPRLRRTRVQGFSVAMRRVFHRPEEPEV